MSQSTPPVPKQRPKTEMCLTSQRILKDAEPEYGNDVPTEAKPTVERNMAVEVNYLETENRELVHQVNLLKADVSALQNDLSKERAANREREQLLLKRESDLQILQQKLGDERCDLQRERIRLQGIEDELTVMKKDLEHKEFDLRNMEGDEGELSAHIATRERKLSEQEEMLQRLKMEMEEKTKMLQQWEATLQHQQHEFSIQQQQHDIAMQRRWEQLQREYAVQQQPNYNPYGPQLPYWSPPVGHSSGPDLYQSAPQQPRPVFEPKKYQRPLDSSGEVLPLRAPDLSAGKNPSTCSYQSHPAANIVDGKNLKHGSQAWLDNELAIALRQEEEDQQKAYQDQLRKDEELAMKLQAEWGSENAKNLQGQQEKQDLPQLQGQEH